MDKTRNTEQGRLQYILFDLDGTLTDPKEGITRSVQYTLRHYGIEEENLDRLTPFIGPPLTDSFERYYGFDAKRAREAVYVYREYFDARGWRENRVYPGIPALLGHLKEAGLTLMTASSKPETAVRRIMDHFALSSYFTFIGGADDDGERCRKADVIRYVLAESGMGSEAHTLAKTVMVGDREHDVYGARACGIPCAAVLYGYGSREEMDACRPRWRAATVAELEALLLGMREEQP